MSRGHEYLRASEPFDAAAWKVHGEAADTYYAQLHAKHFDPVTATGSVFIDREIPDLDALLAYAHTHGGLDRDDRDAYSDLPPESLRDTSTYVRVEGVDGLAGAVLARDLPPDTIVTVHTTKTGVPPDLVVTGQPRVPVSHATIVMFDEMIDGEHTGRRVVATAFPGDPSTPVPNSRATLTDGQQFTVSDLDPWETILIRP